MWVDGLMPSIRVLLQLKIATSIRVWRAWPVTIETAVYLCSCMSCAGVPCCLDSQWSWGHSSCLLPPVLNPHFAMSKSQESREWPGRLDKALKLCIQDDIVASKDWKQLPSDKPPCFDHLNCSMTLWAVKDQVFPEGANLIRKSIQIHPS